MNANPRESYPPEWKNTFQHIDPILNHIFSWCIYLNIRQVRVQVVGTGTGGVRSHQAESSTGRSVEIFAISSGETAGFYS